MVIIHMITIFRVKHLPVIERDFPQLPLWEPRGKYSESTHKQTPTERKKGVHNWCWPLTGMQNTDFVWELRRTGFCEGSYK